MGGTSESGAAGGSSRHPMHKGAPIRENEVQRLDVLKSLNLLDTDVEEAFDRITQAASATLKVRDGAPRRNGRKHACATLPAAIVASRAQNSQTGKGMGASRENASR